MLHLSKFLFLVWMPADCRRIKDDLCPPQRRQPRCFRIPLVPANTDADFPARRVPRPESEIARSEVKFFVIEGIIGNMHLAVLTEQFSIRVDNRRRVVIKTGAA